MSSPPQGNSDLVTLEPLRDLEAPSLEDPLRGREAGFLPSVVTSLDLMLSLNAPVKQHRRVEWWSI